jgi:hypothetical protein
MRTVCLLLYHLFGSWNSFGYCLASRIDRWVSGPARMPINDSTQLLIDGPGGSGLTSFVKYVEKWNPAVCVAHHNHSGYLYRLAKRKNIPVVCITRPMRECVRSLKDRYPDSNRLLIPHLRYIIVVTCAKLSKAHFTSFDEVVSDPRSVISELNAISNLNLNEGDGILPHERPCQSECEPPKSIDPL